MQASDIASVRLRCQRLSAGAFTQPDEVVRWQGAVQAQEYDDAKWGLALRMRRAGDDGIERAFAEGRILRTHVLRPTWHFVAPEDIRWMLALTGPGISRRMAVYNRQLELDASIFRRSLKVIARALTGGAHLTRKELNTALERGGIQSATGQRLAHIVMQAELEGVICSGPRRGRHVTYALLDERVPPAPALARDEALGELARRYLRSHGPAQIQDYSWWSGLAMRDARAGIEMAGPELGREVIDGKTYWFQPLRRAAAPTRTAYLLPLYDEYLIAYKDRSAALDRTLWTWTAGMSFAAPVVVGGQVVGGWKRRTGRTSVVVTVTPFTRLSRSDAGLVEGAARRYAAFLDLELDLDMVPVARAPRVRKA
jgi:hypothetical protein